MFERYDAHIPTATIVLMLIDRRSRVSRLLLSDAQRNLAESTLLCRCSLKPYSCRTINPT
jgi:hypothetical protein